MDFNKMDTSGTESLTILDFGYDFDKKFKQLKILVADDDPPSRMLLRACLTQWGYEVIEAADGEEAWNILQQPDPPRLLILDWIMPKIDGINLCTKIRKELFESSRFYIILLSQVSGSANIKIAIESGANEFIPKPFDQQELRSRMHSAARIIVFANELVAQNKQLTTEAVAMKELYNTIISMTKKIDEIIANSSRLEPALMQKIQELKVGLTRALNLVKGVRP